MKHRTLILLVAVGALLVGGLVGGVVQASATVSNSNGSVNACYKMKNGNLRVQVTSCKSSEVPITLSGANDTAGPTGLGTETIETFNTGTAACPADHPYVLGGGYYSLVPVSYSYPSNSGTWVAGAPDVYAICAK